METNVNNPLLKSIGNVYDVTKDSKLNDEVFDKLDDELKLLSQYFHETPLNTFVLSLVLGLNIKMDTVDYEDLTSHLDCNPLKIFEYIEVFDDLFKKGMLSKTKNNSRKQRFNRMFQFRVNEKIVEAIVKNEAFPDLKAKEITDLLELFEEIYNLSESREAEETDTMSLVRDSDHLIETHQHFPFIKAMSDLIYNSHFRYIYIYVIWKTLNGKESTDMGKMMETICDAPKLRILLTQQMVTSENDLIKNNLIELVPASFFNDTSLQITNKTIAMLKESGIKLLSEKAKKENLLEAVNIPYKELLYNPGEAIQANMLSGLLQENKYNEMLERLRSKNLPAGITVLLHGVPGTGKTESVLQLARQSGRDIFKVDISSTKSMWFGQSEKLIKRIFTDYYELAKKSEVTPILFFNEADAIISKRKDVDSSSVGQTENAIQNILLEELEKFEGIFFATTNLIKNLDAAFERRFLFKVEFHKPDTELKISLWKLKLPFLSHSECEILAQRFDFSGAQMENILRKCEMHEVIQGLSVTFDEIIGFCNSELFTDNKKIKIGFTKN